MSQVIDVGEVDQVPLTLHAAASRIKQACHKGNEKVWRLTHPDVRLATVAVGLPLLVQEPLQEPSGTP